jgi:mitogen-activated protein kinase organizer 1
MAAYPTKSIRTLAEHTGAVHCVTYNSNGQYCLSGSRDRSVMLWNTATGARIKTYAGHGRDVLDVTVYVSLLESTVWNRVCAMLTFSSYRSTRDNSRFASCGNDRAVLTWDVSTGSVIRRYAGHYESVNCVGFNDDGTVLASGSFDTTIRLWDCRSQSYSPIQILEDCKDSVMSLQIVGVELIVGYVFSLCLSVHYKWLYILSPLH